MKSLKTLFCEFTKNTPVFQYLAMVTGNLNILCSGMHYGWPSPSLPKLEDETIIPLTKAEGSWLVVMPLLGNVCGSIMTTLILNAMGRKNVVLLCSFPYFASWIMVAYAKSLSVLLAGRFIAGVSNSLIYCALPVYLGEIADLKFRGFLGSSVSVSLICGTLLVNVIGSYLSIKTTALISSVVPLLCLITFFWMPESPYYLITEGKFEQARKNLRTFKGTDDVESELKRLTQAVKTQQENTGKYLDLFTVKGNRKAILIVTAIHSVRQLSGINAITFYAHTIFQEAGDLLPPSTAAITYFSIQVVFCLWCSMIVDRIGRKPLLIASITGAGFALSIEGVYFFLLNKTNTDLTWFGWVPLVALIIFVVASSMGMQTIPVLLLGELFPTNVKAFAVSLSNIYYCLTATVASKCFQITKDEFGLHVPFFGFTLFCMLGLIFIIFCVPETKNKTLEEIQEELSRKRKSASGVNKMPERFQMTAQR